MKQYLINSSPTVLYYQLSDGSSATLEPGYALDISAFMERYVISYHAEAIIATDGDMVSRVWGQVSA